ncbi:uncharacterized protein LOC127375248 [Dicentrarchus labrax]|uniref:uncharacterized protein LOC127375248 n=1 Tax=Dicentrarchus labrax TaxID=13489 RepID=UPI0021F54A5A|nr:uncharacterized protein LOC127375248 [Dicentrarchus labrax]
MVKKRWIFCFGLRQLPQRERKKRKWTPEAMGQVQSFATAIFKQRHPDERRGKLGQTWLNFRRRKGHCFTSRTSDIIDRGRASCAKRGPIEDYFKLLTTTLVEHGFREKPHQIYNCDETGFQLDSSRRKVIVPRGTKHAYRQAQRGWGECPPFHHIQGGISRGALQQGGGPRRPLREVTGRVHGELLRKWFVGHFLKFAAQERPLLVLDGHKSHLDPELVRVVQREEVNLLCLPPHTSHILQPLDMSFFGPLKADFSGITGDLSFLVSKVKDCGVVVAGFRRCGLYPLDPEAIDWSCVMPPGQRRGTSSPHPPNPSASSWAMPDVTHPSPPAITPTPQSPSLVPQPPNPYHTHPLVTSGKITVDLAHLLTEVHYNTGKVRRNTTKARLLTAQEMSDAIEEADRAARREAQALAREQQQAKNNGPTATSSTLPGGSRPQPQKNSLSLQLQPFHIPTKPACSWLSNG